MNFSLSFTYQFKDPDWIKKILLPAVIMLIPIVGQIYLAGWLVEITRRVIFNDPTPLAEVRFGEYIGKGFKSVVVSLVYALPVILLSLPISIVSAFAGSGDQQTMGILIGLVSVCFGLLIFIYSLVMAFILPAAIGNLAAKGAIGDGLRFGEVFGLVKAAPGAYAFCLIGSLISGFIAPLGSIACGIGVLATSAYSFTFMAHLYGQAYNQAIINRGFAAQ